MAKCEVCAKSINTARRHSHRGSNVTKRTLRIQKPNIRRVRLVWNGVTRKAYVCSECLRSGKVERPS